MNEHRVELKKMTSMAEERLAEYAREEEERISTCIYI